MRRLILESSVEEFTKLAGETSRVSIQKVKTFEILHVLRFDSSESAAVCRIELKDPKGRVEDIYEEGAAKVVLLEVEKEGTYICFVKSNPERISADLAGTGIYFSGLGEVRDGKVKIGVVGDTKQLKAFIGFIESTGIHFRIASIIDSAFSSVTPLRCLTEKQHDVLSQAYKYGYYDLPRRISSADLAKKMGLKSSTLIEHRRKAEKRLLGQLFENHV